MRYPLAQDIGGSTPFGPRRRVDDALDPIRGILVGALISIVGFWLPLALALSR